jgi:hypothetical protein
MQAYFYSIIKQGRGTTRSLKDETHLFTQVVRVHCMGYAWAHATPSHTVRRGSCRGVWCEWEYGMDHTSLYIT